MPPSAPSKRPVVTAEPHPSTVSQPQLISAAVARPGSGLAVLRDYLHFLRTGISLPSAAARLLHGNLQTRGGIGVALSGLSRVRGYTKFPAAFGLLGEMHGARLSSHLKRLRTEGYCVFPGALPVALTEALRELVAAMASDAMTESALLEASEVQNLIADYSLWSLAQGYLGVSPILVPPHHSWRDAGVVAASEAEGFGFCGDRLRALRFRVVLAEASREQPTLAVIRGSHRLFAKPRAVLRQGYRAWTGEALGLHYPSQDFHTLAVQSGTVVAFDPAIFHRALASGSGGMASFEIEFASSLFGRSFSRSSLSPRPHSQLELLTQIYPAGFRTFLL